MSFRELNVLRHQTRSDFADRDQIQNDRLLRAPILQEVFLAHPGRVALRELNGLRHVLQVILDSQFLQVRLLGPWESE